MGSSLQRESPQLEVVAGPHTKKMEDMIKAFWISQIVGTLAQLGIPDHLASGALAAGELAEKISCHCEATFRLLRAAKQLDLVTSASDGRFSLTALGQTLRSNGQGSMRDFAIAFTAPGHWLPWGRLSEAVRTGHCQTTKTLGDELFEYYSNNPIEGRAFTGAMSDISAQVADEVARVLDTSSAKHVVDVGGASGTLIAALLFENPTLVGTILDRSDVVPRAESAVAALGLSYRCSVVTGDFFAAVPEADIHILKLIIHDWNDERSISILSNCARALRSGGKVVIVERLMPEDDRASRTPLADLNMLVLLPGRERTLREYGDLVARAGLRLDRVTGTASPFSVIEATAA
jgi:SAM-dependent methyltransferase